MENHLDAINRTDVNSTFKVEHNFPDNVYDVACKFEVNARCLNISLWHVNAANLIVLVIQNCAYDCYFTIFTEQRNVLAEFNFQPAVYEKLALGLIRKNSFFKSNKPRV